MIIFCPSTCADGDTLLPCVGESSRRLASADCTISQAKFTHNDWKTGAQWGVGVVVDSVVCGGLCGHGVPL